MLGIFLYCHIVHLVFFLSSFTRFTVGCLYIFFLFWHRWICRRSVYIFVSQTVHWPLSYLLSWSGSINVRNMPLICYVKTGFSVQHELFNWCIMKYFTLNDTKRPFANAHASPSIQQQHSSQIKWTLASQSTNSSLENKTRQNDDFN